MKANINTVISPIVGSEKQSEDLIRNLMDEFNNPQDDLSFIHVAGTNGKGSTCAVLNQIYIRKIIIKSKM